MTLLQQICADMADSQNQLQLMYRLEHKKLHALVQDLPASRASHEHRIKVCADLLAVNFPAANDATILPGAA